MPTLQEPEIIAAINATPGLRYNPGCNNLRAGDVWFTDEYGPGIHGYEDCARVIHFYVVEGRDLPSDTSWMIDESVYFAKYQLLWNKLQTVQPYWIRDFGTGTQGGFLKASTVQSDNGTWRIAHELITWSRYS